MITFWIFAALLTLLALIFIMPTLLRQQDKQKLDTNAQRTTNISLYKERLTELDALTEKAETDLEQQALVEQKNELQRRLLHELDRPKNQKQHQGHPIVTWSIVLALPIMTIFLYQHLGSPAQAFADESNAVSLSQRQAPSMEEMVDKLKSRLEKEPEDAEGWMMLGRAYQMMNKQAEASTAYQKSIENDPLPKASLLVAYAESLALSNKTDLTGKPTELLAQALKLEPNNINALWLSGVAAYKTNNNESALQFWQTARDLSTPASEEFNSLNQQIIELEKNMGISSPSNVLAQQQTAELPAETATVKQSIQISVKISPEIQALANPEHTLFIYAQAATGPKMPLAIIRKQTKDIPLQVKLDSSMAMMPTMSLDNFDEVVLLARISASGQAIPQTGDFLGKSATISWKDLASAAVIDIMINQKY